MQRARQDTVRRMDIMEFDRFLRAFDSVALCYDSAAQTTYNPWENQTEFYLAFTGWNVYKSPNILILKDGDSTMTLRSVRMITVEESDTGFIAEISYMGGIRGQSSIILFIYNNIIN